MPAKQKKDPEKSRVKEQNTEHNKNENINSESSSVEDDLKSREIVNKEIEKTQQEQKETD